MKNILFPFSLLVGAQFVWAISWFLVKKLIDSRSAIFIYWIETVIIFLIVLPLVFYYAKDLKNLTREAWILIIISCILTVAGTLMYFIGFKDLSYTSAALSSLTFLLFTTILGVIFLKESLTLKFFIASILMVAGFLVLVL